MRRDSYITALKRYFNIEELVCPHIYDRWKTSSWQFLDTHFIHTLLIVRRDILKVPMVCNNGQEFTQRGLRCNRCQLVTSKKYPYLSAHVLGKAGDFTVCGMTAFEARQKIKANKHLLPVNIRLEGGVSWLHIDIIPQWGIKNKVYEFRV